MPSSRDPLLAFDTGLRPAQIHAEDPRLLETPFGAMALFRLHEEIVCVQVDDGDPFAVLALGRHTVALTRDECRRVADALRAASHRRPPRL